MCRINTESLKLIHIASWQWAVRHFGEFTDFGIVLAVPSCTPTHLYNLNVVQALAIYWSLRPLATVKHEILAAVKFCVFSILNFSQEEMFAPKIFSFLVKRESRENFMFYITALSQVHCSDLHKWLK